MHRRDVLKAVGAAGWALLSPRIFGAGPRKNDWKSRFVFDAPPFALGVASGDPAPRSVVLWSRVCPRPLSPDGFGGLVERAVPVEWFVATDPQMRTVVRRGLATARRDVAYSVTVGVAQLEPGTTYWYRFECDKRSSRIGRTRTAAEAPAQVRFASISCQDFNTEYGAFHNLASEPLDFVVHLGDAIYEAALGEPAMDLPAYRLKHAFFRGDPRARAAWAAHPFLMTWDDHEVADNYVGTDPAVRDRRDAAYRAYYEHMPVRWPQGGVKRTGELRLRRHATFGDLLEIDLLDLRQYRVPGQTLLGASQRRWLRRRMSSPAQWACLASSVRMADRINPDAWHGYPAERDAIVAQIASQRPGRAIVLSGDAHHSSVCRVASVEGSPVAIEFGVPAISSTAAAPERADPDRGFAPNAAAPWQIYQDPGYRGYLVCSVNRAAWTASYRALKNAESVAMTTLAEFVVTAAGGQAAVASSGFRPFEA